MPEISRFFGIIIRMFYEPQSKHHRPHFHAYYQGQNVSISIDEEIEVLAGSLPKKQERLAWAEVHRKELLDNYTLMQLGEKPFSIEPLK